MVYYGKKNPFDTNVNDAVKAVDTPNPQPSGQPFDFSHQLFTVQISTGGMGPAAYHRSLLRGLLTMMQYQGKHNINYAPSEMLDVSMVLRFMQELLMDRGEHAKIKEALGIPHIM